MNPATGTVEVIEKATYKPFGEQSEWLSPTQGAPESKGWIGERFDADAGLQYLNARYYDPVLGMFLQPDWFEVTKAGVGTNRYSYCAGDPVNCSDSTGNVPDNWATKEKPTAYDSSGFRHEYRGKGKLDKVTYNSRNDQRKKDYLEVLNDPGGTKLQGEIGVLTEKLIVDGGGKGGTYGHQSYDRLEKMDVWKLLDPPIVRSSIDIDIALALSGAGVLRFGSGSVAASVDRSVLETLLPNGNPVGVAGFRYEAWRTVGRPEFDTILSELMKYSKPAANPKTRYGWPQYDLGTSGWMGVRSSKDFGTTLDFNFPGLTRC